MGFGNKPQDPTGVIGCSEKVKDPVKPCIRNNTIIEFRPHRGYDGKFGFDWLRIDDNPVAQQVPTERIYRESILGSYKTGHATSSTDCPYAAAFNDLKNEAYYKLEVNNHRVAPKNEYFIPWLNIFPEKASIAANDAYRQKILAETGTAQDMPVKPPYKVELRMIANVQGDKPEKVELEFPSQYFKVNNSTSPMTISSTGNHFVADSPPINKSVPGTIEIWCIEEFAEQQYIEAYAYQYVYTKTERDNFANQNQTLETENNDLETKNTELANQQKALEEARDKALEAKYAVDNELKAIAEESKQSNIEYNIKLFTEINPAKTTALMTESLAKMAEFGKRMKVQNKLLAEKIAALQEASHKLNENLRKQRANNNKLDQNKKNIEDNKNKIADEKKTLAGKLCICPNDAGHRKTLKVAQVSVVVSLTGNPLDVLTGMFPADEIERFYNGLYQALIIPEETIVELNLVNDKEFQTGGEFINSQGNLIGSTPTEGLYLKGQSSFLGLSWGGIHSHLAKKLKEQEKGKYNDCLKAFAIDLMCQRQSGVSIYTTFGQVQDINTKNVIITRLTAFAQDGTYVHEVLHGLGLWHTHLHSNNESLPKVAQYVYYAPFAIGGTSYPNYLMDASQQKTTDNIMSYTNQRYTTWHWQWEIVQSNV